MNEIMDKLEEFLLRFLELLPGIFSVVVSVVLMAWLVKEMIASFW